MQRASLYFTSPARVTICTEEIPPLEPEQLLIQTLFSAISPGTEMLIYRGQFPRDALYIVGFSLYAREFDPAQLPTLSWDEWNVGTNMHR